MIITFLVLCFWSAMPDAAWDPELLMFNFTDAPMWVLGLLGLFAFGIPVFFLFLLGLKILVNNLKTVGSITKYTLLAIWILSVIVLVLLGIRQATEFSSESKATSKHIINLAENDTLFIKFRHNDYFTKSIEDNSRVKLTQDSLQNEVLYSNNIALHVLKTDRSKPYIQIEKRAHGSSMTEARKTAENIKYSFEINGNTLLLDNYLLTDVSNKFRNQEVDIYLYLPEGTLISPDSSVQNYYDSIESVLNLSYGDSEDYVYKMEKHEARCLNCPPEEENEENESVEWNDEEGIIIREKNDEGATTRVRINRNGINVDIDNDSIVKIPPAPSAPPVNNK